MRVSDLPDGCLRVVHPPAVRDPFRPSPTLLIPRALAIILAALLALLTSTAAIGEQSSLAQLLAEPPWRTALRAPNPGVALSPQVTGATITASLVRGAAAPDGERTQKNDQPLTAALPALPPVLELQSVLTAPSAATLPSRPFVSPRAADDAAFGSQNEAAAPPLRTAYADDRVGIDEPFNLLLSNEAANLRLPHGVSGQGRDHWWSDRPLPQGITGKKEVRCLAQAIYFESRGEPAVGQAAVAQVVINRVKNPAYPDDVCSVVFQNHKWYNRCQFTFTCDRKKDIVRDKAAWDIAMRLAKAYTSGTLWLPEIGAATHYHAQHVTPKWASLMRQVKAIDNHIFYITKNGGWT